MAIKFIAHLVFILSFEIYAASIATAYRRAFPVIGGFIYQKSKYGFNNRKPSQYQDRLAYENCTLEKSLIPRIADLSTYLGAKALLKDLTDNLYLNKGSEKIVTERLLHRVARNPSISDLRADVAFISRVRIGEDFIGDKEKYLLNHKEYRIFTHMEADTFIKKLRNNYHWSDEEIEMAKMEMYQYIREKMSGLELCSVIARIARLNAKYCTEADLQMAMFMARQNMAEILIYILRLDKAKSSHSS